MTRRITPLLLVGLTLIACSSDANEQATSNAAEVAAPSPEEAAIEQVRAAYVEHYNLHHPAEVAKLYGDSAFVLGADMIVLEGRAEVQKSLETALAASPTLSLTTRNTMVVGDHAVTLGEYSVTSGTGAQASTMGGTYLVLLHDNNGRWEIVGNLNNLNAAPPSGFVQSSGKEAPPEKGEMKEFTAKFTQLYDASDWAGLAGMYTADAKVAFSQAPLIEGTAAIRQRFEQRFGSNSSPKLELHDVGTMTLDADWAVDGGWFTVQAAPPTGRFTQDGMYMNLLQRQPDGSWKTHWSVVNGYPKPDSPKPDA